MYILFLILFFLNLIYFNYPIKSQITKIKIPKIIETKIYEGNEFINEINELSFDQRSNILISGKYFEVKIKNFYLNKQINLKKKLNL